MSSASLNVFSVSLPSLSFILTVTVPFLASTFVIFASFWFLSSLFDLSLSLLSLSAAIASTANRASTPTEPNIARRTRHLLHLIPGRDADGQRARGRTARR